MFARALAALGARIDEAGASYHRTCPGRLSLYGHLAKAKQSISCAWWYILNPPM